MINLIPKQEKDKMIKNFYFRLLVIFFTMLGFSFVFGIFALAPSYFLIYFKEDLIEETLALENSKTIPQSSLEAVNLIEDLHKKLVIIKNSQNNKFFISEKVVNEIISEKMFDIKLTQIAYEYVPATGKKVMIRGTAPSRERLLAFRQALEGNSAFKKVDLPISNFVRGSNIQFSMNLVPN